jgi:hypothetical protein
VSLPDLGLTQTTDSNGSFAFGFGLPASRALPGGRHRVVFNPGMGNPRFGTTEQWANVEEGRLNRMGATTLQVLNRDEPFRHVASGQSQAVLAAGDLVMDLSAAQLAFANGRGEGDVQMEFLTIEKVPFPALGSAMPNWVFATQPGGVKISGQVGVTINAPTLYGDHSYLPATGTLVVMVGFDSNARQLVPVGVGRIDGTRISSVKPLPLGSLDYLGYAFVEPAQQAMLEQYRNGEIDLSTLIRMLEG